MSSTTRGESKEAAGHHEDPMPSTSDFVKKLYKCVFCVRSRVRGDGVSNDIGFCRMLEDPAFQSVVSWGPQGDCFVVKVRLHSFAMGATC